MESLLKILMIFLTVVYIITIVIEEIRIKRLKKEDKLRKVSFENSQRLHGKFAAEIEKQNLVIKENEKEIETLKTSVYSLLDPDANLMVYTCSNFYKNYNVHNKRYYAKINTKATNNKAEAIPVLQIKGGSNQVLDLYELKGKILNGKYSFGFSLVDAIRSSYIKKEDLIEKLGDKVLKTYKG